MDIASVEGIREEVGRTEKFSGEGHKFPLNVGLKIGQLFDYRKLYNKIAFMNSKSAPVGEQSSSTRLLQTDKLTDKQRIT